VQWRRFTIVVVAFALLAAACGGGGDDGDRERFAAQGNVVCRQLRQGFDRVGLQPRPGTRAAAVWELRVQQLAQRAYARLEALEPPDDLRDEHDALVEAVALNRRHVRRIRVLAAANAREIDSGISDGPAQRAFLDLSADIDRDQARVRRAFAALGWNQCAILTG